MSGQNTPAHVAVVDSWWNGDEGFALTAFCGQRPPPGTKLYPEARVKAHDDLLAALGLLLDQVDYTKGACGLTEMVGACLDAKVIDRCRAAIATATGSAT